MSSEFQIGDWVSIDDALSSRGFVVGHIERTRRNPQLQVLVTHSRNGLSDDVVPLSLYHWDVDEVFVDEVSLIKRLSVEEILTSNEFGPGITKYFADNVIEISLTCVQCGRTQVCRKRDASRFWKTTGFTSLCIPCSCDNVKEPLDGYHRIHHSRDSQAYWHHRFKAESLAGTLRLALPES